MTLEWIFAYVYMAVAICYLVFVLALVFGVLK